MVKFFILLLATLTFSTSTLSESIDQIAKQNNAKFVKVKVVVYPKDTLAKILRRFVREDSIINRKTAMVDRTLNSNPHIKDWRNLETGETISVYLDPQFIDMEKMKAFRKDVKKVAKTIKKKVEKKKEQKEGIKKWSTFYMASVGTFSQENDSVAKVEFKQNSPVTLGLMYTHYPKSNRYSIATSAYFSYLLAASSNLGEDNVEVPLEIGWNVYYQHPIANAKFNVYGGFDYEKFNTFSMAGVESDEELLFDENQIGFATVGYSQGFKIKNRGFLFKASLSQSVFSSRTAGSSNDNDDSSYTGQKIMLFLLSKVKKDYFISTLFKYHILSGPSDVNVMRVGLGFGYLF